MSSGGGRCATNARYTVRRLQMLGCIHTIPAVFESASKTFFLGYISINFITYLGASSFNESLILMAKQQKPAFN
jgi:hypothetical protein